MLRNLDFIRFRKRREPDYIYVYYIYIYARTKAYLSPPFSSVNGPIFFYFFHRARAPSARRRTVSARFCSPLYKNTIPFNYFRARVVFIVPIKIRKCVPGFLTLRFPRARTLNYAYLIYAARAHKHDAPECA